jgi:hypothetical protein
MIAGWTVRPRTTKLSGDWTNGYRARALTGKAMFRFSLAAILTFSIGVAVMMPIGIWAWKHADLMADHVFISFWTLGFPLVLASQVEGYVRGKGRREP